MSEPRPIRILVTGSRTWTDKHAIATAITEVLRERCSGGEVDFLTGNAVVVHGHCPTGADRLADEWCRANFIEVERHPADWDTFGKRAGYLRNASMVEKGADICLAFIANNSPGASMTARMAENAGIPTKVFTL